MLQQKESYDVLRLIEHGQLCYISSENVQGKTLDRYLKYHPVIKKREIFLLLKEIAGQLASFHRCRGNPCYQYVNPYSIVRSEDGRTTFAPRNWTNLLKIQLTVYCSDVGDQPDMPEVQQPSHVYNI